MSTARQSTTATTGSTASLLLTFTRFDFSGKQLGKFKDTYKDEDEQENHATAVKLAVLEKIKELRDDKSTAIEVDFSENYLHGKLVQHLAYWLQNKSGRGPQFVTLNLRANELDDEDAKLLAEACASPHAPISIAINLELNKMSDKAAGYWADAIKKRHGQLVVSLDGNSLTAKGAALLEQARKEALPKQIIPYQIEKQSEDRVRSSYRSR